MIRLCNFSWNSNAGKPGSQHYCALENGHVGPHECRGVKGTCNEVTRVTDENTHLEIPFHLRVDEVMGDVDIEIIETCQPVLEKT